MSLLSRDQPYLVVCARSGSHHSPPEMAAAYSDKPMARGAVLPWPGLATAAAYTVMTRRNVIMVSHPNTPPAETPLPGAKQPGEPSPEPICSAGMSEV